MRKKLNKKKRDPSGEPESRFFYLRGDLVHHGLLGEVEDVLLVGLHTLVVFLRTDNDLLELPSTPSHHPKHVGGGAPGG